VSTTRLTIKDRDGDVLGTLILDAELVTYSDWAVEKIGRRTAEAISRTIEGEPALTIVREDGCSDPWCGACWGAAP
jgi:hypothetical protein